jgi:hypothetical protein
MVDVDIVVGQFKYGVLGMSDRMAFKMGKPLWTYVDEKAYKYWHKSVPPHMKSLDDKMPSNGAKWIRENFDVVSAKLKWERILREEFGVSPKHVSFIGDLSTANQDAANAIGARFGWYREFLLNDKLVVCGTFPKWCRRFGKKYIFHAMGSDLREHPEEAGKAKIVTSDPVLAKQYDEMVDVDITYIAPLS